MHPNVGHGLALFREPDHVHRWRVSRCSARSAFQRGLKFPDRRIARPADVFERNAGFGFAATAFQLQPAVAAIGIARSSAMAARGRHIPPSGLTTLPPRRNRPRGSPAWLLPARPQRESGRPSTGNQILPVATWCSWLANSPAFAGPRWRTLISRSNPTRRRCAAVHELIEHIK
jgi:hypothetical protein